MKKSLMFGLAVALFSQIILAKEIGKVAIIRGDAAMVRAKAENKIKIGNAVSEGDEIITQPGGYVKVVMQDRNILVVAENSKLSIDEYITAKDKKNVAITVEYGSARHVLKQKYVKKNEKYEVRTATTVAGVRGTDFLTIYKKDAAESVICTLEGKVSLDLLKGGVAEQKPVLVAAGHFVRVKSGDSSPQVIETDKAWLEKALKSHSLE